MRSFIMLAVLAPVSGCLWGWDGYEIDTDIETDSPCDTDAAGDTDTSDTDQADTDDTDTEDTDVAITLEPVIVRQMPTIPGERVYSAADPGPADWMDIEIHNPNIVGVRLHELIVLAHGDDDGGGNGMNEGIDPAARVRVCFLYQEANKLDADIIRYENFGIQYLKFKPYDEVIGAGEYVDYAFACQRDLNIVVADTGEFYSLSVPTYGVVVTDLYNSPVVTAQTLDLEGNPGEINIVPNIWVAYYPE